MSINVTFPSQEHMLSGSLTLPVQRPCGYALFAHCFTCGKNSVAARRITDALSAHGVGVLRFDFTGLGDSEGEFGNTNFSSNLDDLKAAVSFLREHYQAPQLLIGHSLGGTAVLAMAAQEPEVKAVVSIGAPFSAGHVVHNFEQAVQTIARAGEATVDLGGRPFTIKQQFLEDVAHFDGRQLAGMKKALLLMHAPTDRIVAIDEAEKIYHAAKHPKSFVSLDKADHLLSKPADAEYVADTIAAWSRPFWSSAVIEDTPSALEKGQVEVAEFDHVLTQRVSSAAHQWIMDEPVALGGGDRGPDPYEHLLAALGGCTAMTLRLYATRKQWPLTHVEVRQAHGITPIESDTIIDEVCHEAGGICPMCKQELDHAP